MADVSGYQILVPSHRKRLEDAFSRPAREESKGLGQRKKEFMEHYQNHVTFKLGFYNLVVDTENFFFIVDKLRF